MNGTRVPTILAVVAGMLVGVAVPVSAGATPTTGAGLAGEVLEIGPAWSPSMVSQEAVEACDGPGVARVRFHIEGSATGPYPGTFVETGVVFIGPRTGTTTGSTGVEIGAGRVLGIVASFHIRSGGTSVQGVKWIVHPAGVFAGCDTYVDAPSDLNPGWLLTGFDLLFEGLPVRYRARITTPDGAWVEQGTGSVALTAEHFVVTACPTSCSSEGSAAGFHEVFS